MTALLHEVIFSSWLWKLSDLTLVLMVQNWGIFVLSSSMEENRDKGHTPAVSLKSFPKASHTMYLVASHWPELNPWPQGRLYYYGRKENRYGDNWQSATLLQLDVVALCFVFPSILIISHLGYVVICLLCWILDLSETVFFIFSSLALYIKFST